MLARTAQQLNRNAPHSWHRPSARMVPLSPPMMAGMMARVQAQHRYPAGLLSSLQDEPSRDHAHYFSLPGEMNPSALSDDKAQWTVCAAIACLQIELRRLGRPWHYLS